ncbi:hypothetical protein [Streptomyces hypolithicus]
MGIDLFDVHQLHLTEAEAPPLSPEDESARDRVWDKAVQANPTLFDGPVVACAGLGWTGPHTLTLSWVRVTYRHYALRRVPSATALPSLFVNVVQRSAAVQFVPPHRQQRIQRVVPEGQPDGVIVRFSRGGGEAEIGGVQESAQAPGQGDGKVAAGVTPGRRSGDPVLNSALVGLQGGAAFGGDRPYGFG